MNLVDFLNCLDDMIFIIKDKNGKIIYPVDLSIIDYLDRLVRVGTDEYYDQYNGYWYRLEEKHLPSGEIITKCVDITKYKEKQLFLETDKTTGLIIKRKLIEDFEEYVIHAIIRGESFSISMSDIDFFKRVNDNYGHLVGDKTLNTVAQTILKSTRHVLVNENISGKFKRPVDIVGKYGGEEFLVVMKNMPEEAALRRAEDIRKNVENASFSYTYPNDGVTKTLNVTISQGTLYVPSETLRKFRSQFKYVKDMCESLVHEADVMMYESKEKGKNQTTYKVLSL